MIIHIESIILLDKIHLSIFLRCYIIPSITQGPIMDKELSKLISTKIIHRIVSFPQKWIASKDILGDFMSLENIRVQMADREVLCWLEESQEWEILPLTEVDLDRIFDVTYDALYSREEFTRRALVTDAAMKFLGVNAT